MLHECPSCHELKEASEFSMRKDRTLRPCRTCDRVRGLLTKYGITLKEYETMRGNQDNKCRICSKETNKLVVDHCHKSKKIRGLLCNECNMALGKLEDNITLFCMAIKYLNEARNL